MNRSNLWSRSRRSRSRIHPPWRIRCQLLDLRRKFGIYSLQVLNSCRISLALLRVSVKSLRHFLRVSLINIRYGILLRLHKFRHRFIVRKFQARFLLNMNALEFKHRIMMFFFELRHGFRIIKHMLCVKKCNDDTKKQA